MLGFHPTCGGCAEGTCDPTGSLPLHGSERAKGAFHLGALKIPQPVTIHGYRDHTCPIQDVFVLRGEASCRIAQHLHCHDSGEGLSGIKADVLLKCQLPIEPEAQVPPVLLGPQRKVTHIGCIPQVQQVVKPSPGTGEVE